MSTTELIDQSVPTGAITPQPEADDLPSVVYTPESPLRNPVRMLHELAADLWRSRELIWILFMRDLKAQFRQSYLGYVWLFVPPLLTTAVWLFLNSQQVVTIRNTGMPYPVFVLIGTVLWQTFSKALTGPLTAFNNGVSVFRWAGASVFRSSVGPPRWATP